VERLEVRGRKGRGRPKKRWKDCVNQDLGEKNVSGHEVHNRASNVSGLKFPPELDLKQIRFVLRTAGFLLSCPSLFDFGTIRPQ
jgi:hypothetical protein